MPFTTMYSFDSRGLIPSKVRDPDRDWIKQSQIDGVISTSQTLQKAPLQKALVGAGVVVPPCTSSDAQRNRTQL